jgi:transposase
MVKPNFAKWGQSIDEIRTLGIEASHARSRERFQALYMIGSKLKSAYQWALEINRQPRTVLNWLHIYNDKGPKATHYQSSGRCAPLLTAQEQELIVQTVTSSEPIEHELLGHGWTVKKLGHWVSSKLGKKVSRNTLRTLLKSAGLSWKQCKKIFGKGNPEKRKAYVEQFQVLYERMCRGELRIIYIDEAHFHQDMDLGYTWSPIGDPTWRKSICPSLSSRLNWYGAYDFTEGRCLLWHNEACNNQHTSCHLAQKLFP